VAIDHDDSDLSQLKLKVEGHVLLLTPPGLRFVHQSNLVVNTLLIDGFDVVENINIFSFILILK
jgi:hypothetical protein